MIDLDRESSSEIIDNKNTNDITSNLKVSTEFFYKPEKLEKKLIRNGSTPNSKSTRQYKIINLNQESSGRK